MANEIHGRTQSRSLHKRSYSSYPSGYKGEREGQHTSTEELRTGRNTGTKPRAYPEPIRQLGPAPMIREHSATGVDVFVEQTGRHPLQRLTELQSHQTDRRRKKCCGSEGRNRGLKPRRKHILDDKVVRNEGIGIQTLGQNAGSLRREENTKCELMFAERKERKKKRTDAACASTIDGAIARKARSATSTRACM